MPYETELKFLNVDFVSVRKKLSALNAICKGRHLERNVVFDTSALELKENDKLLRLRSKQWKDRSEYVLTFKSPPAESVSSDVKVYDERETKVDSFEGTYGVLKGLGYDAAFRYDKVREEWAYKGVEICLDELPFGFVVELEGSREDIFALARQLEFSMECASTSTYHDLNRDYRKQNGLAHQDSFYFTEEQYQCYMNEL